MLASTKHWGILVGLLLAACESEVEIEPSSEGTGAGDSGTTSTGNATSSSVGATSTNTSGAGGAPSDCENVPTYLQNLLDAAQSCNPAELSLHCQHVVEGYCCPAVVENISSPATQAYLDFLALSKRDCPDIWTQCYAVDCAEPQTGFCLETGINKGQCEPYGPD